MSAKVERTLALAERLLAGRISDAEAEELGRLLREDAGALDAYIRFTDLHGTLATHPDLAAPRRVVTTQFAPAPRPAWLPWALAASVAVLVSLTAFWFRGAERAMPTVADLPQDYLATLAAQEDCVWENGGALTSGQRLAAGTLRLARGRALLQFDGGARVVLVGPAELRLESPGAARVVTGRVAVQAPEEAVGFRLTTAQGTAVDLGTEFVVNVDAQGTAECAVLEGQVEWHSAQPARKTALLASGEARRFRDGGVQPLAAATGRFADFMPRLAAEAAGELLAYEPFDYAEPMMTADRAHGGTGWPSPWLGPLASEKVDVAPRMEFEPGASLAFGGLAAPRGGSLVFGAQRSFRARALPRPVDFGSDGVHYISFLMRAMPPTAAAGPKPGPMRFALVSSSGHVWVAVSLGTSFRPLILAQGNNNSAGEPLTAGETVFVVCKVVTSRQGADQMFLRVYRSGESIEAGETTHWTVSSRALHFDDVLDHVELAIPRSEGGRFDELRVGTSWAAVVPLEKTP